MEVHPREWWKIEIRPISGAAPAAPAEVQTVFGKYLVARQDRGWRVEAWDLDEPEDAGGTAAGGAEADGAPAGDDSGS